MPTIADYERRINLFHNSVSIIFALVFIWSPFFRSLAAALSVSSLPRCPHSPLSYPHLSTHSLALVWPLIHSFIHSFVPLLHLCRLNSFDFSYAEPLPLSLTFRWSSFLCVPFCHPTHPTFDSEWQTSNDIRHSIRQIVAEAIPRISGCIYSAYQWRCDTYKHKLSPCHRTAKKAEHPANQPASQLYVLYFWYNSYDCFEFSTDSLAFFSSLFCFHQFVSFNVRSGWVAWLLLAFGCLVALAGFTCWLFSVIVANKEARNSKNKIWEVEGKKHCCIHRHKERTIKRQEWMRNKKAGKKGQRKT